MNTAQLLKLLYTNRELIQRNNVHAVEHLQMLKSNYAHITDEEIVLNLELNTSLAEFHFQSHNGKAITNSLNAVKKLKQTDHQNLLARHYWLVGHCYANTGEYKLAKKYLLLALLCVTPNKPEYITIKSDVLMALAMNEEMAGKDHQKAIEYLEQAVALLTAEHHAIYRATCLMGLGNVYINIEQTHDALEYYNQAVKIYESRFDLANMASAYSNLGTCYINLKDYILAEHYLQKSLDMRLKFGTPQQLSISYYNLALVYKDTNRKAKAYEALLAGKEILLPTDNRHFLNEIDDLIKIVLEEMETGQLQNAS